MVTFELRHAEIKFDRGIVLRRGKIAECKIVLMMHACVIILILILIG